MTNKEAIKKVKAYLTDYLPQEEYNEVEEIVEALQSPKWILVSERLPESGQYVLVTTRRLNLPEIDTCIFHYASPFWRYYVIAWMPLPEPYKPESEVNDDE